MKTFVLHNDSFKSNAIRFIQNLPTKPLYKCVISEVKSIRSIEQNAKMWAMLTDISRQVDWYSNKLSKEEWKIVLTAGLKKQKVVPGLDGGFVAIGSSTSKMSIAEMADLITLGYAFGNEKGVKWSEVEVLEKIPIEAYED